MYLPLEFGKTFVYCLHVPSQSVSFRPPDRQIKMKDITVKSKILTLHKYESMSTRSER